MDESAYHIASEKHSINGEVKNIEIFVLDRHAPGLNLRILEGDVITRGNWNGLCQIILRDIPILVDSAGRIYYYQNGYYHLDFNEQGLKCLITAFCTYYQQTELSTPSSLQKILSYISNISSPIPLSPPLNFINFRNGMYDIYTQILSPHDPSYRSLIQIPVTYDPNASGDAWAKFIASVVPADSVEQLWRVIGLVLIPFIEAQKAVVLLGEGNNGKGIFLTSLQKLLGDENHSTLSLKQLNDRFFTGMLVGKLANICTEESIGPLEDTAIFKALVAGEPISLDVKHKQPVQAKIFSRLILATNGLPKTVDTSFGFFRRFSIFRFPHKFAQDPELGANLKISLQDNYECSSAINTALKYLPSTMKEGICPSKTMQKELDRYIDTEAPEKRYLANYLRDCKNNTIPKADIYAGYVEFCKELGLRASSDVHFWRYVRGVKLDWTHTRARINGVQTYVLMGCDWKPDM